MRKQRLALEGGRPAVPQGAFGQRPAVTGLERRKINGFLNRPDFGVGLDASSRPSNLLARQWADYLGVKHCLAVNSGTAALHMCVAALDIGPGDEVIVPALTFWASAAAVLHHNAIPVFVDIEPRTFGIDPAKIEAKISPFTKAIMPVHLHGMPAEMGNILKLAKKHGLKVISDACQAHGSQYRGKKIGAIEDAAGFSMEVSKPLSSGSEGGLFVTNDDLYFARAQMLRQFGEKIIPGRKRAYNAFGVGWNYRISEFGAVFGLCQLERLDAAIRKRRRCCDLISSGLKKLQGVKPPFTPADRDPVYFNYVVEFSPADAGVDMDPRTFRECMEKALRSEGVPMGTWQNIPVPAQAVFLKKNAYGKGCPWKCAHYRGSVSYRPEDYPETLRFLESHSYLGPFGGKIVPETRELAERCLEGFHKVFDNLDRVLALLNPGGKGK